MPNPLDPLLNDPQFAKFPDAQKQDLAHKFLLQKDPDYAKMAPQEQNKALGGLFGQYNAQRAMQLGQPAAAPAQTGLLQYAPGYRAPSPEEQAKQAQTEKGMLRTEGTTQELIPTTGPIEGAIYAATMPEVKAAGLGWEGAKKFGRIALGNEFIGKVQQLAAEQFPNHPYIAGAIGGLLGGAAYEGALSSPRMIGKPLFQGSKLIQTGAEQAATEAEQVGAKGMEELGQQRLAERAELAADPGATGATGKVGTAVEAQQNFQQALADSQTQTDQQTAKLQQQLATKYGPQAREEGLRQHLGGPPAVSERLGIHDPFDQTAMATTSQANYGNKIHTDLNAPIASATEAWGRERDRVLGGKGVLKRPVDLPIEADPNDPFPEVNPLKETIDNELANKGLNFNSTSKSLFARAKQLMRIPLDPEEAKASAGGKPGAVAGSDQELFDLTFPKGSSGRELATPESKQRLIASIKADMAAKGTTIEDLRAAAGKHPDGFTKGEAPPIEGEEQRPPATVEEYLALQKSAKAAMRSARDATNYNAALAVSNGVDNVIERIGGDVPELKGLYSRYRVFRGEHFPPELQSTIATGNVNDIGKEMFNYQGPSGSNERFNSWMRGATSEQKLTMRDVHTQYVLNQLAAGKSVGQVISPMQREVFAQLYPHTQLSTPEGFARILEKERSFEDVVRSSPELQHQVMAEYNTGRQEIAFNASQQLTRQVLADAKKMGPLGQQIIAKVSAAAGDPMQQARIASREMFGMTPEQAVQALMKTQPTIEQGGAQAIAKKFSFPAETPTQKLPMAPPTTPEEAAVRAIRTGQIPSEGPVMYRVKRYWPIFLSMTGAYAMMGHAPSAYILGMGLLGTAVKPVTMIREAFMHSLENPERAAAYWRDLQSAPSAFSAARMTRQMLNSQVQRAGGYLSGPGVRPPTTATPSATPTATPEDEGETSKASSPMNRAMARMDAERIASPGNADRVETVMATSRDLQGGGTPDVGTDLRTGRLSVPAVKRMLAQMNQRNAPAMLRMMPPDDRRYLASLATDQERQWLLPMMARV